MVLCYGSYLDAKCETDGKTPALREYPVKSMWVKAKPQKVEQRNTENLIFIKEANPPAKY